MMKKISTFIVRNRKWFVILFAILLVGGIVGAFFVDTNFSDVAYLPDDSTVSIGLDKMYGAFGEGGNASSMVTNVSYQQAIDFKEQIVDTAGVKDVIWMDDLFFGIKIGDKAIIKDAVNPAGITQGLSLIHI